jgi:hypothetical protein
VPGAVVKRVVKAGLRAARRRDGGDKVARAETAWTWWTLPPGRWAPGPEIPQVPTDLFAFVLNELDRG